MERDNPEHLNFILVFQMANLVTLSSAKAAELKMIVLDQATSIYSLAEGSLGDLFGNFLYSASQQAYEAVQDQLSALSFGSNIWGRPRDKSFTMYTQCFASDTWLYWCIWIWQKQS